MSKYSLFLIHFLKYYLYYFQGNKRNIFKVLISIDFLLFNKINYFGNIVLENYLSILL